MFLPDIEEYLKDDRQWPRPLRIAHAKLELRLANEADEKGLAEFWEAVIERNQD